MEAAGTLELIAEISVAFAGFTGLVGAFRAKGQSSYVHGAEGRILIEYSLHMLASALAPLLTWHLTSDESLAWRAGSVVAAGGSIAYYALRFRTLREDMLSFNTASSQLFYALIVSDTVLNVAHVTNVLGLSPWHPSVIFLIGIAYQMLGTGMSFLRFASPLWSSERTT